MKLGNLLPGLGLLICSCQTLEVYTPQPDEACNTAHLNKQHTVSVRFNDLRKDPVYSTELKKTIMDCLSQYFMLTELAPEAAAGDYIAIDLIAYEVSGSKEDLIAKTSMSVTNHKSDGLSKTVSIHKKIVVQNSKDANGPTALQISLSDAIYALVTNMNSFYE